VVNVVAGQLGHEAVEPGDLAGGGVHDLTDAPEALPRRAPVGAVLDDLPLT
jgi:hypothetical protein